MLHFLDVDCLGTTVSFCFFEFDFVAFSDGICFNIADVEEHVIFVFFGSFRRDKTIVLHVVEELDCTLHDSNTSSAFAGLTTLNETKL